jgi:dTDP-glucose 4,6-dehydratase
MTADVDVALGDLRDVESAERAVSGNEVVLHLGAQIAIPYSYVNPRDFFETNVLGTLNVANGVRDGTAHRLVHTSTSEVYGSAQTIPIDEDHPLRPQSPYAASKVAADKLVESFHLSYDLPATILRPFNTYGPGQSARAIVPTIVSQALRGAPVRLGALTPRRDLTYVDDTVQGFIDAAAAPAAVGRTIQLGTGDAVSIRELVSAVGDILDTDLAIELDQERLRPPRSEVETLISSPVRAHELLGWRPQVTLREGLEATISWIRENPHRYRPGEYAR